MPELFKTISEFGSPNFNPKKNILRLSIQLRLNGFSFCVADQKEKKLEYFSELALLHSTKSNQQDWNQLALAFEDFLIQKKVDISSFNEILISIDHSYYTILPSSFFNPDNRKHSLEFTQNIQFEYSAESQTILNTKLDLIFAIPLELKVLLSDYFPETKITHTSGLLIKAVSITMWKENASVYAYVSGRELHLLVFDKNEFLFLNSFNYTSKEDFIYFVLLVYHQNHLNPDLNPLFLLGEINPSSAIYNICYQYIRNTSILNKQIPNLIISQEFDNLSIHQYFIQLNHAL